MKGLGRGLDALFDSGRTPQPGDSVKRLPLNALMPNPEQPRRNFSEHSLEELAASIRTQGLLQPIIVRPVPGAAPARYEIVAGERRYRASKLAGLAEVPVIVRELSDQDALIIALVENLQREDLNPLEEAQGMLQLKEQFSFSQDDLAQKLGKSRSAVANTLRLLNLGPAIRQDLADGRLSAGHGRALLTVSEPDAQEALRKKIIAENLSVREAEGLAAQWKDARGPAAGQEDQQPKKGLPAISPKAVPRSAALFALQEKISGAVRLPVKITGKENKGRLSISYSSREELQAVLNLLGVQAESSGEQA